MALLDVHHLPHLPSRHWPGNLVPLSATGVRFLLFRRNSLFHFSGVTCRLVVLRRTACRLRGTKWRCRSRLVIGKSKHASTLPWGWGEGREGEVGCSQVKRVGMVFLQKYDLCRSFRLIHCYLYIADLFGKSTIWNICRLPLCLCSRNWRNCKFLRIQCFQ